MRGAPLNYLVTAAIAGVLWVIGGVFVGNYLGDRVALQQMTTEDFLATYRLALAAAAVVGLAATAYWYAYGARESTVMELGQARRTWVGLLAGLAVAAAAVVAFLALRLRQETVAAGDYVIVFAILSLQTYLLFWVCSLLLSPRAVEYVPIGKR